MTNAPATTSIDTQHGDMIHDAQLDYYSKRLATCSSDRTIKIFDVENPQQATAKLTGHDGPVWQVSWAHPKFGVLLASCSYDKSVIIHKEDAATGQWTAIEKATHHSSSVNSVAWAPWHYGLHLACASSDGTASVLSFSQQQGWAVQSIPVGAMGCNSVSWAPWNHQGSKTAEGKPILRLVTGSCEAQVKIWRFDNETNSWIQDGDSIVSHSDWVRDVAWAPNSGMPCNTVASCGEDGKVFVHTQNTQEEPASWKSKLVHNFGAPVWRVSWSVTGNILAASAGDSEVTLWKEALDGSWLQVSSVSEAGALQSSGIPNVQ